MAPSSTATIAKDTGLAAQEVDVASNVVSSGLASIGPPKFADPHEERQYLKGRLALAFRIFAKLGYDEG